MGTTPSHTVAIADRVIGAAEPTFVVAEIGPNHMGDLAQAFRLIDAAAQAGADAVKFQLYRPGDMTADVPSWRIHGGPWNDSTLWEIYTEGQTPVEWIPELFDAVRGRGMIPFASPFSRWAVDALEEVGCPVYKIASLELGELGLIAYASATGKPLIMSTGMATHDRICRAVEACATPVVLLHCVAGYPTPLPEVNLRTISDLRVRFGDPVGLSDHSCEPLVAELAVGLGARMIEAHLMLPGTKCLDATHSLTSQEFKDMVAGIRHAEVALGGSRFNLPSLPSERRTDTFARRGLYASALYAGHGLQPEDTVRLRAPEGWPADTPLPVGRELSRDVKQYDPIQPEDFR